MQLAVAFRPVESASEFHPDDGGVAMRSTAVRGSYSNRHLSKLKCTRLDRLSARSRRIQGNLNLNCGPLPWPGTNLHSPSKQPEPFLHAAKTKAGSG